MNSNWYTIINPTSGNGKSLKHLDFIKKEFIKNNINTTIVLTKYIHHEKELVLLAIKNGYTKFISVGGDGTLHHIVNGIMNQTIIESNKIKVAVIPVGTGNDWVNTYQIPNNIKQVVKIIKKENTFLQDIGQISLLDKKDKLYFNNLAGIGYDAFVVKRILNYKKLGSLTYLIAGLVSFFNFKKEFIHVTIAEKIIKSKIFMISIGLCKYSGSNMQLTDYKNHTQGFFDITLIKNITLFKIIKNIHKLYNGKLFDLEEVATYKNKTILITSNNSLYIQADGELLGKGNVEINIITKAIQFIIP